MNFSQKATENYTKGYTCSEAVVRAAYECGLFKTDNIEEINKISSVFAGGMSSGCLCGAVAGAQIVLGLIFGRNDINHQTDFRKIAASYINEFKDIRKTTCCKALSAKYKFSSTERKENCTNIVEDAAKVLEKIYLENKVEHVNI